jgi:plastocyanin
MKKTMFFLLLASSLLVSWACTDNHSTPTYGYSYNPMNTPTPTPTGSLTPTGTPTGSATPTITSTPSGAPVTITVIGGPHYALAGSSSQLSAPITITTGASIVWDTTNASGHPLNIDNGSGTCMVSGQTTFPFTQTFNSTGTYPFHCGVHSSCGNGTCGNSCTGLMVGTIQVN